MTLICGDHTTPALKIDDHIPLYPAVYASRPMHDIIQSVLIRKCRNWEEGRHDRTAMLMTLSHTLHGHHLMPVGLAHEVHERFHPNHPKSLARSKTAHLDHVDRDHDDGVAEKKSAANFRTNPG